MSLIDTKKIEDVIEFSKKIKKLIVITRGEKGALAILNEKVVECSARKNLKVIDLTGAGDLFAGGFLDKFLKGKSIEECLEKGTEMSSKIIQIIGARLKYWLKTIVKKSTDVSIQIFYYFNWFYSQI